MAFANLSGPRHLLLDFGGFDEGFSGWGGEDAEFALRLVRAGVSIRYEPEAVAWHHQSRGLFELCRTKVDEGRNLVRLLDLHPDAVDEYLPRRRRTWIDRLLAAVRPRSAWLYMALARVAAGSAWVAENLRLPRSSDLVGFATVASTAAGIAQSDATRRYLRRFLVVDVPDAAP